MLFTILEEDDYVVQILERELQFAQAKNVSFPFPRNHRLIAEYRRHSARPVEYRTVGERRLVLSLCSDN